MKRAGFSLVLTVVCASPSSAAACNILFVPGDAYFATSWSETHLEEAAQGAVRFYYDLYGPTSLCGHAGYRTLEVHGIDADTLERLEEAHRRAFNALPSLASDGRRWGGADIGYIDDRRIPLLIYPKDYDLSRGLFHRFNEDFIERLDQIGVDTRGLEPPSSAETVTAQSVSPLSPHMPSLPNIEQPFAIDAPMVIDVSAVQLVFLDAGTEFKPFTLPPSPILKETRVVLAGDAGVQTMAYDDAGRLQPNAFFERRHVLGLLLAMALLAMLIL